MEARRKLVAIEEEEAGIHAANAQALQEECQVELNQALPALYGTMAIKIFSKILICVQNLSCHFGHNILKSHLYGRNIFLICNANLVHSMRTNQMASYSLFS